MKVIFAIPMSTNDACINRRRGSLARLKLQCDLNEIDCKIVTVQGDEGIATKVNKVIDMITDEDYFCFMHDDMFVDDPNWIKTFIEIYENKELKCGVLGLVPHNDSLIREVNDLLEFCTFADGVMFMSTELAESRFSEEYKAECESFDFCLEALLKGYRNYRVLLPYTHKQTPIYKYDKGTNKRRWIDLAKHNSKWQNKMTRDKWKKIVE